MNYFYTAYNLRIVSELELPELELSEVSTNCDLSIRLGVVPECIDLGNEDAYCQADKTHVLINFSGIVRALIDKAGKQVSIQPIDPNPLSVRCVLLSSILSAVLYARKVFLLHAGAIAINGKAYAFCGDSGAGKSTLCAGLMQKGYQSLSDDLIALDDDSGYKSVIPGVPRLRLNTDALNSLKLKSSEFIQMPLQPEKSGQINNISFYKHESQLMHLLVLEPYSGDEVYFEEVKGLEKISILHQNSFRLEIAQLLFSSAEYMSICATISQQIRVSRFYRPAGAFCVDEMIHLMELELF